MKKLSTIIFVLLFATNPAYAVIAWVDDNGAATWANCQSAYDSPLSGTDACGLDTALGNAVAGDTIYLRAGTYTDDLTPMNSGTSGNYITFEAYENDPEWSVVFSTTSYGSNLSSLNYIKIKGIYFNDTGSRWMLLNNSNHNWVDNCRFYDSISGGGIRVENGSDYNKFTFLYFDQDSPAVSAPTVQSDPEDFMEFRTTSVGNLVEDCDFSGKVSHNAIDTDGDYLVIRRCTFKNEWHRGIGVHEVIKTSPVILIEDCDFADNGIDYTTNPNTDTQSDPARDNMGLQLGAYGIVRNNSFWNNNSGIYFGGWSAYTAEGSKIYHNSMYDSNYDHLLVYMNNTIEVNNVEVKNNAFFTNGEHQILNYTDYGTPENYFRFNAWEDGDDTFAFKNTSTDRSLSYLETNYPSEWMDNVESADFGWMSPATGDFTLTSNSTDLIDAGTWLTTITSPSGSGAIIYVLDSKYFYDGWSIPGEVGDTIYTSIGQVAIITAVDGGYGENSIELDRAINWSYGDGITVVNYNGDKPDIGAYEYDEEDPEPPEVYTLGNRAVYNASGMTGVYSPYGSDIK